MWYVISFLIGVLSGFILTKIFSEKVKRIEADIKNDLAVLHVRLAGIDDKVEADVKAKITKIDTKLDNLEKKIDDGLFKK